MGTQSNIIDWEALGMLHRPASRVSGGGNDGQGAFQYALFDHGLYPPEIIADGKIHRFATKGKRNKDGYYALHLLEFGCVGIYGDWSRDPEVIHFKSFREKGLTDAQRFLMQQQIAELKRQQEEENQQRIAEGRAKAQEEIKKMPLADGDFPYFKKKGIGAAPDVRQSLEEAAIVIPAYTMHHGIQTYQRLYADGEKRFMQGGSPKGAFFAIDGERSHICLCEGYATAYTVHQAKGFLTVCAFNAGNLPNVAKQFCAQFPQSKLIICADNDHGKERNVGMLAAKKAAEATGAAIACPPIEPDITDFNDLACLHGIDQVRECINTSITNQDRILKGEDLKPEPLPGLPPVEQFDYFLLPDDLCAWCKNIAERLQCPPDFVAVGAMTAAAAVIGRKVGIRPQALTDWTVVANLWGLIIGRPGVLKRPAFEAALAPINRLASNATEEFKKKMAEFKKQETIAKMRADAGKKAAEKKLAKDPSSDVLALLAVDDPDVPTLFRYKTNDSTPASLGELLRQNPNGLLIYRDELVSLLRGLDREDQAEGRGFYLTGWNGDSPYTFDRIGRGLNLHIEVVCISILGGTQPGKFSDYIRHAVKGGPEDDGLIQRFGLLVWSDMKKGWKDVDRYPDNKANLAKYRKLIPALALIIHLVDGNTGPVGRQAILKAVAWSKYLESHARRAYGSISQPEVTAAQAILRRIDKGHLPNSFSSRDIWRRGWSMLSDRQEVTDALSLLVDYGHLEKEHLSTGGRTATVYHVIEKENDKKAY